MQSDKTTNVCHTVGCVNAAAGVLQYVDASVEPCDDFYDFACGKFLSEITLTDDKVSVDTFSFARDKMQKQLLQLIDSPIENSDLKYDMCKFVCCFFSYKFNSGFDNLLLFMLMQQILQIGQRIIFHVHESNTNRRV